MGVHGLWQLLQPSGKPIALETLEGKVLAVDVSIWLNKAAKGMRDRFGNPIHNAHLIVIFHRICKLLFYKVKPVFVFDGGVPELKKKTIASRRERRIAAEGKAYQTSKKILHNYLKGKAIETATGKKGPKQTNSSEQQGQDLFELAPMPVFYEIESSSEDEDNVDVESEWMAGMRSENVEKMFEEIGNVDMDAEDFIKLPPEIQHELLMEMKDSYRRRYNRRKSQQMPEEAHDFSDFQLKNLFRRGKITKRIDDVRKQMNSRSSGDVGELEEGSFFGKNQKNFEANRVASEDKQHYILLKKDKKKGQNILFNTVLDTDHLEIYEGVKRKENFDRLEREPVQFNSAYIDGFRNIPFMSDSGEESDFDEEFILAEAEKLTYCRRSNAKGRESSEAVVDESGGAKVHVSSRVHVPESSDVPLVDVKTGFPVENESFVSKRTLEQNANEEICLPSSGESTDEIDKTGDIVRFLKKEEKSSETTDGSPELGQEDLGAPYTGDSPGDSLDKKENGEGPSRVGAIEKYGKKPSQGLDTSDVTSITQIPKEGADNVSLSVERTETYVSSNEIASPFVVIESNVKEIPSLVTEPKEDGTLVIDEDSSVVCESTEDQNIELKGKLYENVDGKVTCQTESNSMPDKVIEDDVSAVPKPDIQPTNQEAADQHFSDTEMQEFKNTVKDCHSAEQLNAIQDTLIQEQNDLLRERDRQSRAAASVGNEEYNDVQELLMLFGIPFVVSPMEAEAQCAVLDVTGQTDGSITDDSDILLFGGKRVYKNIFNQEKYAELYTIDNIGHALLLNRERMIALAYLTGSDYTEGLSGVGVITAMEILQEFGGEPMQALINLKNWFAEVKAVNEIDIFERDTKLKSKLRGCELPRSFPNHQVWEAYMSPTVDHSEEPFEWGKPDLDAIREFARNKFGWRSSRTDELILPVLKQLNTKQTQTTLRRYFADPQYAPKATVSSKRLQRTVNLMRAGVYGNVEGDLERPKASKRARDTSTQDPNEARTSFKPDESNASTLGRLASNVSKRNAYKKKRVPSTREFQKRIEKSKAYSRGRKIKRPVIIRSSQLPKRNEIARHVLDLSDSSSDSED